MTKEKRYILVTGGYGFIGSNFIRDWYNKYPNYFLVNLDILTYAGNPDNLKDIEEIEGKKEHADRRYEFFRGDVCDPIIVGSIFEKYPISGIIHFAAETHVDRSYHNASDFVRTNIEGTRHMMDMVKKYNVSKMVHVSTDEVYGDVPEGAVKEDYAFSPSNPYAASKAGADLLVQSYVKVYKLPINIVRGSNNYGPYQYPEKLIPVTISHLLEGKQIPVHGDGKHVRQWIHTHDFGTGIDIVFHNQHLK
jgi:dTDP-glucose 4,6-dehydratase